MGDGGDIGDLELGVSHNVNERRQGGHVPFRGRGGQADCCSYGRSSILRLLLKISHHFLLQYLSGSTVLESAILNTVCFVACSPVPKAQQWQELRVAGMVLLQRMGIASLGKCRLLSAVVRPNISMTGQGGLLSVRLPSGRTVVRVTTKWTDTCTVGVSRLIAKVDGLEDGGVGPSEIQRLDFDNLAADGLTLAMDKSLRQITLSSRQDEAYPQTGSYLLEAVVPEMFSVDILAAHGSVTVINKLKGDCRVRLRNGDIDVGVVRGNNIGLSTGCGQVVAGELEGNVNIAATKVTLALV